MKKLIFALSLFLFAGAAVNAQACSKKCTKGTAAACTSKKSADTKVASAYMEADAIAIADESIEKRVCNVSGTVAYFQKSQCEVSGKVAWDEVKFDKENNKFTRVASASMEKNPTTGEVKACCAKGTASTGKKCCASKKAGA